MVTLTAPARITLRGATGIDIAAFPAEAAVVATPGTGLEFYSYPAQTPFDDSTRAFLPLRHSPQWSDPLNASGGNGSLTLDISTPKALIGKRRWIRAFHDGYPCATFRVKRRSKVLERDGSEYWKVEGPDLRTAVLGSDYVRHEVYTGTAGDTVPQYAPQLRAFSAAGLRFDIDRDTRFDDHAFSLGALAGTGWQAEVAEVAPLAELICTSSDGTEPKGVGHYRERQFWSDAAMELTFAVGAQVPWTAVVNGNEVMSGQARTSGKAVVQLIEGVNQFYVRTRVAGSGAGDRACAVAFGLAEVVEGPEGDTYGAVFLDSSRTTIRCAHVPHGDTPPGWSHLRVQRRAQKESEDFCEANDQFSLLSVLSYTFSDYTDSYGDPWTSVVDMMVSVGTSHDKLLTELCDTGDVEAYIRPGGRFYMAPQVGVDRSTGDDPIIWRVGQSVTEWVEEVEQGEGNRYVFVTDEGFGEVWDIASGGEAHGNFLMLGNADSVKHGTRVANEAIDQWGGSQDLLTVDIDPPDEFMPYRACWPGDWVLVEDAEGTRTRVRILGFNPSEDADGRLSWRPQLVVDP